MLLKSSIGGSFFKFPSRCFKQNNRNNLLNNFNLRYSSVSTSILKQEDQSQINIDGYLINYSQVGTGPCTVFCFPGILGSMRIQLPDQIRDFAKDQFTFVTWDQPGYGKSRPPARIFTDDSMSEDAELSTLGFKNYSVMGWSGGGCSALLSAIRYPKIINKLVLWGAFSYVDKDDADNFKWFGKTDNWGSKMKESLLTEYEEDFFNEHFSWWMNSFARIYADRSGDVCSSKLHEIQCPTLVIHGTEDVIVNLKHGKFLTENIKNAKYVEWPKGKHNMHLRYPKEFNKIVQDFLLKEL